MRTKLVKHGDDYAVIIDVRALQQIGATPDTRFEVTVDGGCLILTPVRDPEREAKLRNALDRVNEQFGDALRRLAE